VDHFNLRPFLKLGCRITSIEPITKSVDQKWKHRVKYSDKHNNSQEQTFDCSHVAICTGLHVEPNIPTIPGIENVKGEVFHSSSYKKQSQLTGRDVMILGCGETAMGKVFPSTYSIGNH
jgi:dimethylaniline monooxygenase (N-oxide forming)